MKERWRGPKGRRVSAEDFRPDAHMTTKRTRAGWRTNWPNSVEVLDEGYVLKIVLGYTPPSQNEFLKQSGHWLESSIRRWAKEVIFAGCLNCPALGGIVPQAAKRKVSYKVYRAKALDPDNAWAGLKPITDVLVTLGFLRDDSAQYASVDVEQVAGIPKARRRTEIVIAEADDGEAHSV